jgi:hypothetical protein
MPSSQFAGLKTGEMAQALVFPTICEAFSRSEPSRDRVSPDLRVLIDRRPGARWLQFRFSDPMDVALRPNWLGKS